MQRQSLAHTVVAQERALLPVAAVEVFGPRCRGCLAGRLCQRRSDRPATSLTTAHSFTPKSAQDLQSLHTALRCQSPYTKQEVSLIHVNSQITLTQPSTKRLPASSHSLKPVKQVHERSASALLHFSSSSSFFFLRSSHSFPIADFHFLVIMKLSTWFAGVVMCLYGASCDTSGNQS
jgi:hypothetical protein